MKKKEELLKTLSIEKLEERNEFSICSDPTPSSCFGGNECGNGNWPIYFNQ